MCSDDRAQQDTCLLREILESEIGIKKGGEEDQNRIFSPDNEGYEYNS